MSGAETTRTASCACGGLRVVVVGEPSVVNACACLECQRLTGSAFSYTAFFPEAAVRAIVGEHRAWSHARGEQRSHTRAFCPTCAGTVFTRLDAAPGLIGVSVGAFADPSAAKPSRFFWTSRRHRWLGALEGVEDVSEQ